MQPFASELILNVNDNEASRYTVSRILKREGFQVAEAPTGREAIEVAFAQRPSLVILDIKLPDISGYEVCRTLKLDQRTHNIPVLHLTAHALTTDNKIQSLREGADAYLTFPLEPAYLMATIHSLLRLRHAEAEREILLEREKAERAKLIAALGDLETERALKEQFVATLTHDLRSPLAAIRLGIQLMMRRGDLASQALQQCGKILGNTDRVDRMIQDLLDTSLVRVGKRLPLRVEPFDVRSCLEEIATEFSTTYGPRFELESDARAIEVRLDPSAIRRAVENLLLNAIKYGQSETRITIRLRETIAGIEIAVHNHGRPIAAEHQRRLFDPFHRVSADENKPGWGLGLALVRGVAEAHEGSIDVQSAVGSGTTFTLRLPKAIEQHDPALRNLQASAG
jgi:two-component system, sensor histidine kinase